MTDGEKAVFTVEQRDALRDQVLRLADEDDRAVAGAVVGSLAVPGGGDRFSDLDLMFGIADHVRCSRSSMTGRPRSPVNWAR